MMNKHNFYITPTLIDNFNFYKKFGEQPDKFQELINKINKVPVEYPESAKKGVAFESVVNLVLGGHDVHKKDSFIFDRDLVQRVANKLKNNIGTQVWIDRTVPFKYGDVRLGGFLDYDYPTKQVDLKTTANYRLSKFKEYSQHKCYGLIQPEKKEFIYLCVDWDSNLFVEPYVNKKSNHESFINDVELFYEFTQEHRELITDKKIFNL